MSEPLDFGSDRVCKLFDNFAAPVATDASAPVLVPAGACGARPVRVRLFWGTTPTVVSIAVQRSVDNITYATLYTFSKPLEVDGVDLHTEGYIRVYVTTNTGGANLTVELEYGSDIKARSNLNATNDAEHVFVPMTFKSSATGAGTVVGLLVELEGTGALHYYDNAIWAIMHCNVSAGNLRNPVAVQGDLVFQDGCWVQGLGYGLGTYITFPNNTVTTGTFSGVNIEFSIPASWVGHLNNLKHSMLRFALGGAGAGSFEDSGYLFELAGFTEGSGNIYSAGADVAAAATLRILIGGTKYYILLGAGEST
jgi:hypothetical protein